jgi:hypothetical protein
MNALLTLIGLRAAALSLGLAGQPKASGALYLLADAVEAGRATEEHLRLVAQKLNTREINDDDFDDVQARIESDSSRLQGKHPA